MSLLFFVLLELYTPGFGFQPGQSRERLSLDKGWSFHLGDIPFPVIHVHEQTYLTSKAGSATGAAAAKYDDKDWPCVDLSHDWAVYSSFDSGENVSQGYRHRGYGWYRRGFLLSPSDKGKHIELQFDDIVTNSTIWVNGTVVNRNFCGYTSSYIDISALVHFGEEINTISVRMDADAHEGWW